MQQHLLSSLIIITLQQLYGTGMKIISEGWNASTIELQQQPLFASKGKLLSDLLKLHIAYKACPLPFCGYIVFWV